MRMPYALAYSELVKAQKPAAGVSLYSRYINRRLGRVFAALAASAGLRPDTITAISAVLIVAAVAIMITTPATLVVGIAVSALLVLSFVLDAADGQLARLQKVGSPSGEWLDHVVDAGKNVCIHGGVLIAAYRYFDVFTGWLFAPLAFQLVAVVLSAGGTLRELLGRVRQVAPPTVLAARTWKGVMLLPADSGVLALVFLALPWPDVFVWLYSLMLLANVIIGFLLLAKWRRELKAMRPVPKATSASRNPGS
jgi:phosphatidylglycerophosphate synthase